MTIEHRAAELHDDLLTARRLSDELADGAIEDAVIHACETFDLHHGHWPNVADDETWVRALRPLALDFLGVAEDEVYAMGVAA